MNFPFHTETIPVNGDINGILYVGDSRIPLDSVIHAFHQGATPEEILQQFPALHLADIYQIIGYYLSESERIDAYLKRRERDNASLRETVEARFNPHGLRERLLSRR